METNDIIEGNKLIAEFMGATPIRGEYDMYQVIEDIKDGENEKHFFIPNEMEFNSSWNWLMPVVKKCRFETNHLNERFTQLDIAIQNALCNCEIQNIFETVVDFINWYDENKNK